MSMSDPTAPVGGTPAPESTSDAPTGGTDLSPIMDRMEQLAGSMNEIQSGWQQFQQANAPETEAEPDFWAQAFGEQEPEPETQGPQLDPAALQSAINQAIQQSNAPLLERLQRFEQQQGREQLYQKIPALKDPAVAQKTVEGMHQFLAEAGAPPEIAAWMVNNPRQIELYFKAAEAENAAQAQVPAGGDVPSLETAGGATPGGDGEPQNPIDQIFGSRPAELPKGFR
jgi:hypothetical protein